MTWKIPVTWSMYSTISVEADTLEEAIDIAGDESEDIPLPSFTESDYVYGSWEVAEPDIDIIRSLYNDGQTDDRDHEEADDRDHEEAGEYIKVNIPVSERDYDNGNGEGVWVRVTPLVKELYDNDAAYALVTGILDNDSYYYPGLNAGTEILLETRGENRPVVPYEWLVKHAYGDQKEI